MKHDIFISYSRQDTAIIDEFIKAMRQAGLTVWYDRDGIESGEAFKSKIVSAIEASRIFLFFSSRNSNTSEWTAKEVGIANARKKTIIPIKLDDSLYNRNVEFDLINLDYIDYTDATMRKPSMDKLIRTIQGKLQTESPNTSATERSLHPSATKLSDHSSKLLRGKRGCTFTVSIAFCCILLFLPVISLWPDSPSESGDETPTMSDFTPFPSSKSLYRNPTNHQDISDDGTSSSSDDGEIYTIDIIDSEGVAYAQYTGEILDNRPNGNGTLTFIMPHTIDSADYKGRIANTGDKVKGVFANGHLSVGHWHKADGTKEFIVLDN